MQLSDKWYSISDIPNLIIIAHTHSGKKIGLLDIKFEVIASCIIFVIVDSMADSIKMIIIEKYVLSWLVTKFFAWPWRLW